MAADLQKNGFFNNFLLYAQLKNLLKGILTPLWRRIGG